MKIDASGEFVVDYLGLKDWKTRHSRLLLHRPFSRDFYIPWINWESMSTTPQEIMSVTHTEDLLKSASDHSLTQVIDYKTRKENILNLFYTPTRMNRTEGIPLLSQSDHNIIFVNINAQATITKKKTIPQFLYRKVDWGPFFKTSTT